MRVHLRLAGGLFLVAGGALVLAALSSPWLFDAAASSVRESADEAAELGAAALGFTGRLVSVVSAAFALPCLACGWGVLTRRRWSRLLGSALAAVALVQFPVGTLAGAYLLWVLLSARSEAWFDEPAVGEQSSTD